MRRKVDMTNIIGCSLGKKLEVNLSPLECYILTTYHFVH